MWDAGYCCRKDGVGGNGDCPKSALDYISVAHHVCVKQDLGNQPILQQNHHNNYTYYSIPRDISGYG